MKNKKIKKNKPKSHKARKPKKAKAKKSKATSPATRRRGGKFVMPKIRAKKKNKSSLAMRAEKTVSKKTGVLKKADKQEQGMGRLLSKGKERGYITYDEILKEFPTVEDDILFLDDLYEKLSVSGIDILEGGGLL